MQGSGRRSKRKRPARGIAPAVFRLRRDLAFAGAAFDRLDVDRGDALRPLAELVLDLLADFQPGGALGIATNHAALVDINAIAAVIGHDPAEAVALRPNLDCSDRHLVAPWRRPKPVVRSSPRHPVRR